MLEHDLDEALKKLARRFHWAAAGAAQLRQQVTKLTAEIDEVSRLTPAQILAKRKARIGAIRSMETALRRTRRVMEQQPPWLLGQIQALLADDVAHSFSNAAFDRVGAYIDGGISSRDLESASRYRSSSGEVAHRIEAAAAAERRQAARARGLAVLDGTLQCLADRLENELEREALSAPDGRPANSRRVTALAGLWAIYSGLTDSALPAKPPPEYIAFCADLLEVLGVHPTGLEDAAERLFARAARQRDKAKA